MRRILPLNLLYEIIYSQLKERSTVGNPVCNTFPVTGFTTKGSTVDLLFIWIQITLSDRFRDKTLLKCKYLYISNDLSYLSSSLPVGIVSFSVDK